MADAPVQILTWQQSLRFPLKPRVSRLGVDFIQQLICEPEDRLGSRTSAQTRRPRAISAAERRSGIISNAASGVRDGGDELKAHPWFQGLDFDRIHEQPAPFQPDLRNNAVRRRGDPCDVSSWPSRTRVRGGGPMRFR